MFRGTRRGVSCLFVGRRQATIRTECLRFAVRSQRDLSRQVSTGGSSVMKVRGIEHMTLGELVDQVKQGGRFVVYHWWVGLMVKTVERPSTIRFVHPGGRAGRG